MKATPWTVQEIETACETLGLRPALAVTLHLCLPVDELGGVHARIVGENLLWRGIEVKLPEDEDLIPEASVSLVRRGARPSDSWLDPSDNPLKWLKWRRSGLSTVAFGAELLHGLPPVFAARGLKPEIRDLAVSFLATQLPAVPALPSVLNAEEGSVLLEGDASGVWLYPGTPT